MQNERRHIALFGRCNSGKSSLLNRITGQPTSIVSAEAGTTTDVVKKAMELQGVGAVMWLDTAGLDDQSKLGEERIRRTHQAIDLADLAVVLFGEGDSEIEHTLIEELRRRGRPWIAVVSQCDTLSAPDEVATRIAEQLGTKPLLTSAVTGEGIEELLRQIAAKLPSEERTLTQGLCQAGDRVVLVMPQDASAPKGRLILPQVQTLRELLDKGCLSMCVTPEELPAALAALKEPPQLIITDSQVFDRVYALKPEASRLTSFSVLQARYKGDMATFVAGAHTLLALPPTAHILIAEACTHTPQNEDIGRVKLPRMLRKRLGEELQIDIVGGQEFPDDLSKYDLVIHCGACMFNRQLVLSRVERAHEAQIPMTNYGIAIAALQGILDKISW